MNEDLKINSKEEIIRFYEQNELSEIINSEESLRESIARTKDKLQVCSVFIGAGVLAGAASFFTVLKKNKFF